MFSGNTWRKLQAVSGLGFGIFLVMHLFSHWTTILSQETGNRTLRFLKNIYQNVAFEPMLVASFLVHMMSNTVVFLQRRKVEEMKHKKHDDVNLKGANTSAPPGTLELTGHRYTGYILSVLVLGHVFATRVAPLFALEDPQVYDYTYVSLAAFDFGPGFTLYYIILGMAANWHLVYGTRSALATMAGTSVHGKTFPLPLKVVALMMHMLIIAACLAVSGAFYEIQIPENATEIHAKINAFMGM